MAKVYLLGKTVPMAGSSNVEKLALMAANLYENEEKPNLINLSKKLSNREIAASFDEFEALDKLYSSYLVTFVFGIEDLSYDAIETLSNIEPIYKRSIVGVYNNKNFMLRGDTVSLIEFFEQACCSKMGAEINDVADQMLDICLSEAPNLFKEAGAPCTFGKCNKEVPCKEKKQAKIKQMIKSY